MGDQYNVFGAFENLSSAKFRSVLPEPIPNSDIDNDEVDLLEEFGKVSPKKKTKKDKKKVVDIANVSKESALNLSQEVSMNQSVSRRTRASTRASLGSQDTVSSATSQEASIQKVTKAKGATARPKPPNKKNNAESNATQNATKTKRGRKSKKTNANTTASAVTTPIAESIEIVDEVVSNAPIPRVAVNRNVMRARRDYMAELAARCPTVGVVDLITSPWPRIEGVINVDVDSDEDTKQVSKPKEQKEQSDQLSMSFDEENPELSVKIIWQGQPEIFTLRKYQKFGCIFEQLAEREKTDIDKVFLNLNNQILRPTDTPASINYKIYQFIEGRTMMTGKPATAGIKKKRDPNMLILKVQSDKWKKPLSIELLKTDTFKKLLIKCAEELKLPYSDIKLSFDGDMIQYNDTPVDLELEGGEILEIHFTNHS